MTASIKTPPRLRLAVLCDTVGRYGGTERYWETLLPELAHSYDVRLLARAVEEPDRFGVRAEQIAWSNENAEPSRDAADAVLRVLEGCDAVITSNVFDPLILAAARTRPRWIARVHDYRPFCPNGNKVFPQFPAICTAAMGAACVANAVTRGCVQGPHMESLRRISHRMLVRNRLKEADVVVVASTYVREVCARNGLVRDRVLVAPPPLPDIAFANPVRSRRTNAVVFSGRFNDQKGLASLIRAIGRIPHAHRPPLLVAGDGDHREESRGRAIAQQSGVDVSWRGWLEPAKMRSVFDDALLVAVPSLWPEPFGLAGPEAQARWRPAVAYDVGGVGDWIAGAGISVPRADEAALARAIERLALDEDCWKHYSETAGRLAERFRLANHVRTLESILCVRARESAPA